MHGVRGTTADGTGSSFLPSRPVRTRLIYALCVVVLMALGVGLRREALLTGFVADDYAQLGMLEGKYPVPRSPLNLYNFSDGSVHEGRILMRGGFYPWWSHPRLRLTMLRPLASGMIWLDFQMFGNNPLAYHLHTLAWWLAMLAAVAGLFYRLLRLPVALLGFAFFALDEAHGLPLAWIANRCAIVSTTLCVCALMSHIRFRETQRVRWAIVTAIVFSVALGFGEYALCGFGYFAGYELIARNEPLRARFVALWSTALPSLVYGVMWIALDCGPRHSGLYLAPNTDPLHFVLAIAQRVPVMYADLVLAVRSEFWTFGFPWSPLLHQWGWVSEAWLWSLEPWRRVHVFIGVGALLLLTGIVRATPRTAPYRNVRWLLVGSLMSVLPIVGSFPSSRLLLVALVGFAPTVSALVVSSLQQVRTRAMVAPLRTYGLAALGALLGAYHLVVPAWLTREEVVGLYIGRVFELRAALEMEVDDALLPHQDLVILASLGGGTSTYLPLVRQRFGKTVPRNCWVLSLTPAPHVLYRDAVNSFTLAPVAGYTMVSTSPEQLMRDPAIPFRIGEKVDLGAMAVTVMALEYGRPKTIRVEFDTPLEDPSLLFALPMARRIGRVVMPAIGTAIQLPAPAIPVP